MSTISVVGRVFCASHDWEPDWIGEAIYADLPSAQEWVRLEYEEWCLDLNEDYLPGIMEWVVIGNFYWHLYEDNSHTGVVIIQNAVHKVIA
jgi:hypothetical protein